LLDCIYITKKNVNDCQRRNI
jgi:hypothetical protein